MSKPDPKIEPEWNLLPNDPIGFFELPSDFERKTLKRKYNRLIRQFKPEKSPAEFQKIRAAYELLDGQLRYGTSEKSLASNSDFKWEISDSVKPKPRSDRNIAKDESDETMPLEAPAEIAVPIYQRVESESPVKLFREFEKQRGKSPYDYFAMALIADVVSDDPLMFFKLVLTGIKKHPNENGLLNLLYEYLQRDLESKHLASILVTISKVVTNQRFYFMTEKLWDKLLRESDFLKWRQTLKICEENLKDFQIAGRLAFYVHVMPAAMWKADQKWISGVLDFLKRNSSEIPPALELDFELLYQLRDYQESVRNRECYTSQEIHQAIVSYFSLGGRRGDEAVMSLQSQFAQNAAELLESYRPETPYNNQQIIVWDYINEDVCQRTYLLSSIRPRELRAKIYDLMDDLNRSEFASFGAKDEFLYRAMHWGPYIVAAGTPFFLLGSWVYRPAILLLAMTLAAVAVVLVKFLYKPGDRYDSYMENRMQKRYFSSWRGRFVHLFAATQISHGELSDALIDVVQNHHESLGFATWLCRFLPADVGLHLFASASRYMR